MTTSSWLLSIAGMAVLGVLIDVVLPNGQTNKYVKGMFAFCMLLVIIAPLPALVNKNFDMDSIFAKTEIEIDNDFIYQVNRTKLNYFENQIKKQIEDKGIMHVNIVVNADIFSTNMQIKNVFVDLRNVVISGNASHIDIKKTVLEIVLDNINISKENVIFDG